MKKIHLTFLIIMLVSSGVVSSLGAEKSSSSKVVAYYFRGTFRSPACRHLESYCREAVETNFQAALASGKLEFQVVTLGDKGEGYYAGYYKIYARTFILSLIKDGKEVKWKNLDRIDGFVNDREGFSDYVKSEIAALLGEIE